MTDHADGCYSWGPQHYECARRRIAELAGEVVTMTDEKNRLWTLALKRYEAMQRGEGIDAQNEARIHKLEGFLRRLLCIETCDDCGGDINICRSEQPGCPIREAREFLKGEKG